MLIELTGQVVVFDEAHNMEDAAREAASLSLTSFQLEDLAKEFTDICESHKTAIETRHNICNHSMTKCSLKSLSLSLSFSFSLSFSGGWQWTTIMGSCGQVLSF